MSSSKATHRTGETIEVGEQAVFLPLFRDPTFESIVIIPVHYARFSGVIMEFTDWNGVRMTVSGKRADFAASF